MMNVLALRERSPDYKLLREDVRQLKMNNTDPIWKSENIIRFLATTEKHPISKIVSENNTVCLYKQQTNPPWIYQLCHFQSYQFCFSV